MNAPTPKKHPQSILGFFDKYFNMAGFTNGLTEYPFEKFLEEVQPYHVIAERNFLESFRGVRQALPCAAIRQRRESDGATVYWLFKRTEKIGEAKLAGKTACFWGGHVDAADAVFNDKSVLDLGTTLVVGRDREQGEEYRIIHRDGACGENWSVKVPLTPADQFIANSTVEVDKYHVAIIYTVDLPANYAVEVLEEELIGIPTPMSAQEALDAHEAGEIDLESWALIYFRHVRAQELLDSGAKIEAGAKEDIDSGVYQNTWVGNSDFRVEAGELTDKERKQGYSWPLTFKAPVVGFDMGNAGGPISPPDISLDPSKGGVRNEDGTRTSLAELAQQSADLYLSDAPQEIKDAVADLIPKALAKVHGEFWTKSEEDNPQ